MSAGASEKPFDKILVANRGEIACRVFKTAKRLGIKTVAVYSEADSSALHVRHADEAYCIGPAASADSYLRMERILDNAAFVEMIAADAGCFVIPGYEVKEEGIGYPVMIKASAGGGGKGMRVAYNDNELREGFRMSKAEAMASFGDDRMLIERFIEDPHHIEIQVVADTHGNVIAFPERECSVQRRNQKVVEESPSCLLLPETRRLMQEQAIMLCKATKYRSAGTVEMLCDGEQNFYFLEMNTRLQVEHPITELVSGEDLVEHMLWVAAGKKLPKRLTDQTFVPFKGWALESRVYAEDPLRNFLPSIEADYLANGTDVVRIDTGVFEGGSVSMWYDPMIAKLCTHSPTRERAIEVMENALDQYVVTGLGNNLTFLRDCMRNPRFRSGNYSTKFIETEYSNGFSGVKLDESEVRELVATACAVDQAQKMQNINPSDPTSPTRAFACHELDVNGNAVGDSAEVTVNAMDWVNEAPLIGVEFDGQAGETVVQYANRTADGFNLQFRGATARVVDVSKFLLCPMPGTLISCDIEVGQRVEIGQELAVVEAMKMQNVLRAEKAGVVKSVQAVAGDTLRVDAIIMEFESEEDN
eukprot:GSChrysophyteH1.ASY1.ANO1.1608.1 assembled CDS